MVLEVLKQEFSICEAADISCLDFSDAVLFVGKTDEEVSVVCQSASVPSNAIRCDAGWKAFRVQGELDFSLTGILAGIAAVLSDANIGIFAVSTYRTDYILTKKEAFDQALSALTAAGYKILW